VGVGGTLDGSAITVASEGSAPAPVPAAASASEPEHKKAGEEVDQEGEYRSRRRSFEYFD
jgi:hypothetical protein